MAGKTEFFRCDIDKQTPLEGGMGGGSSNCATALWAANQLCGVCVCVCVCARARALARTQA